MHNYDICHGDLKPENIMLKNKGDLTSLKLIDFGFATKVDAGKHLKIPFGTPIYFAPEVIMQHFDIRIDNWCLGIILYIMISGRFPFSGRNKKEILESIMSASISFNHPPFRIASGQVKDLIFKLLARNPSDRYLAVEALQHPWLTDAAELNDVLLSKDTLTRIANFSTYTEFKKWISYMVSLRVDDKNIADLKRLFIKYDRNKNGFIEREEFAKSSSCLPSLQRLPTRSKTQPLEAADRPALRLLRHQPKQPHRLQRVHRLLHRHQSQRPRKVPPPDLQRNRHRSSRSPRTTTAFSTRKNSDSSSTATHSS